MNDEILRYYNLELDYLRRSGTAFAREYPDRARSLGLSDDAPRDPHTERIIESVAYLNARIRHRIEDDFEDLVEALLGQIYPHYLAPFPSMAIVQAHLSPGQEELAAGAELPAGTYFEFTRQYGSTDGSIPSTSSKPCTFRTTQPIRVLPLKLTSARLTTEMPPGDAPTNAGLALRVTMRTLSDSLPFSALQLGESLRLHLHGEPALVHPLYELLCTRSIAVAWRQAGHSHPARHIRSNRPDGKPDASVLPAPAGFDDSQALLPYPPNAMAGYRIISEYFAFPKKFLFIDFPVPPATSIPPDAREVELVVFLSSHTPHSKTLETRLEPGMLRPNCTPLINLFPKVCEPIEVNGAQPELRVVPSDREPEAFEVFSLMRVTAIPRIGRAFDVPPLYSVRSGAEQATLFYTASRRSASLSTHNTSDPGSEVFLSPVDPDLNPMRSEELTLRVQALCSNRDLPSQLDVAMSSRGPSSGVFTSIDGAPLSIEVLCPPTASLRRRIGRGIAWRLVSHLQLNHLPLAGGGDAAASLRAILRLYDRSPGRDSSARLAGLTGVSTRPVVARDRGAITRGTEVRLTLDESAFPDHSAYLFASVLERFLGHYAHLNSFVQTTASSIQRGVISQWPPRAGETVLL